MVNCYRCNLAANVLYKYGSLVLCIKCHNRANRVLKLWSTGKIDDALTWNTVFGNRHEQIKRKKRKKK